MIIMYTVLAAGVFEKVQTSQHYGLNPVTAGPIRKSYIHSNDDRMISLSARKDQCFTTQFCREELQPSRNGNTVFIIGCDGQLHCFWVSGRML